MLANHVGNGINELGANAGKLGKVVANIPLLGEALGGSRGPVLQSGLSYDNDVGDYLESRGDLLMVTPQQLKDYIDRGTPLPNELFAAPALAVRLRLVRTEYFWGSESFGSAPSLDLSGNVTGTTQLNFDVTFGFQQRCGLDSCWKAPRSEPHRYQRHSQRQHRHWAWPRWPWRPAPFDAAAVHTINNGSGSEMQEDLRVRWWGLQRPCWSTDDTRGWDLYQQSTLTASV